MRKILRLILCGILLGSLLLPFIQVYASEQDSKEQVVTIAYAQALRMALSGTLSERDITVQIRNMQMRHRDLDDEIRRGVPERQNAADSLWNEIQGLDWEIWGAHGQQSMLEQSIEFYMGQLLAGLETGDQVLIAEALPAVIFAIASLQGMGGHIATMEAQRNHIFDEVSRIQNDQQTNNSPREARNNLNELERQMDSLNLHKAQSDLIIELVLRSLIIEIAESHLLVEMLRAEHELAEQNLRRMTLAHELGFISIHDLQAAEHSFDQGRTGLHEVARNQRAIRQDLNHLLGQPLSQYTIVTFNRELMEMPDDLARHIDRAIAQDPTIRQLQIEIDSARGERWAYTGNNNDIRISDSDRRRAATSVGVSGDTVNSDIVNLRNRIALQDAVDRAVLGKEQAVRTLEAAMRRGFADLEGLLAQEAALLRELSQAQAALVVTTTNFDLGHVAQLEVSAAQLNISRIEQDMERIFNQKWVLSFMLENPSLLQ